MKTEIKYKVVNSWGYSAIASGDACIKYEIDEYVTAPEWLRKKGYYPFVFNSLKDGKAFAGVHNARLFKVRVKGNHRKENLPRFLDTRYLAERVVKEITGVFVANTEMWEYVKLLEEIK